MRDEAWNTFAVTGRICDYLSYTQQDEQDGNEKKSVRGEAIYGADHCTYRNGVTDDAHQRL